MSRSPLGLQIFYPNMVINWVVTIKWGSVDKPSYMLGQSGWVLSSEDNQRAPFKMVVSPSTASRPLWWDQAWSLYKDRAWKSGCIWARSPSICLPKFSFQDTSLPLFGSQFSDNWLWLTTTKSSLETHKYLLFFPSVQLCLISAVKNTNVYSASLRKENWKFLLSFFHWCYHI